MASFFFSVLSWFLGLCSSMKSKVVHDVACLYLFLPNPFEEELTHQAACCYAYMVRFIYTLGSARHGTLGTQCVSARGSVKHGTHGDLGVPFLLLQLLDCVGLKRESFKSSVRDLRDNAANL